MTHTARPSFAVVFAAIAALSIAGPADAAQRPSTPSSGQTRTSGQGQVESAPVSTNAKQTREALNEILADYPPSLGRVLKLDPSLLGNDAYLAPYPALLAFVRDHPEIERNVPYYFERVNSDGFQTDERSRDRNEVRELIAGILGGIAGLIVFGVILSTIVWLIKTTLEQRRWNRLSKIQAEIHTKLLDRFTANDELLGYVQTPSGRRFLESGPSPLQETTRTMSAPFSRILWSVQAGVVLAIAGAGMLMVSGRFVPDSEPSHFFFVIGVLTLALGAGFFVSAIAAYALSRKLGLFERPAPDNA
jgi:hypothetical protein